MGVRVHRTKLGDLMSGTEDLATAFKGLFPQLTDQARKQLASEVVRIVDTSTERGCPRTLQK